MPNTPAAVRTRWIAERLLWWPLLAGVGFAWYLFGTRLMHSIGLHQLASAAGLVLAAAVILTLWRWSTRDARRVTLETGACPRCNAIVTPYEYPPLRGVRDEILRGWHCGNCGLEHVQALTASRDAS